MEGSFETGRFETLRVFSGGGGWVVRDRESGFYVRVLAFGPPLAGYTRYSLTSFEAATRFGSEAESKEGW